MLRLLYARRSPRAQTTFSGYIGATMFFISGLAVLVLGVHLISQSATLTRDGVTSKGTIVRYSAGPGSRGRTYYFPLIEYTDVDGKMQTFKEITAGARTPKYPLGETVDVRYQASYPRQAHIDSFGALWMGPIISVLFGLLFSIVGAYLILRERLNGQRSSVAGRNDES